MGDEGPTRFKVIEGGPIEAAAPSRKPYRARSIADAEPLTCSACERSKGVASSMAIEVRLGVMVRAGKVLKGSGTKAVACAHCRAILANY